LIALSFVGNLGDCDILVKPIELVHASATGVGYRAAATPK
jgi:hypothetical protein